MTEIKVKPTKNKCNGQFTFSLPKSQLPKSFKPKIEKLKSITLRSEDFEFDID